MFNVGDRVRAKKFGEGTVVEVDTGLTNTSILVQFDKKNNELHNGNNCSRDSYSSMKCYFYTRSDSDLTKIDPITITTDGRTVIATYDGRTAKAKCNPDDTFDLYIGAQLALKRLFIKPHMEYEGREFLIGVKTETKDVRGTVLYTGDEVEWCDDENVIPSVILDNTLISGATEMFFDHGVYGCVRIIKTRGFADIKHGEVINDVKYIIQ